MPLHFSGSYTLSVSLGGEGNCLWGMLLQGMDGQLN